MKNITLHWRNGFHPAWLVAATAVVLPVLRRIVAGDLYYPDVVCLLVALVFAGAIVLLGLLPPGRIWCQVGKEVRTLLPAALVGLVGPIISRWFEWGADEVGGLLSFLHLLSCAYLAAGVLGAEFDARTIQGLLVHPGGRARIYALKMVVLGVFLAIVTAARLAMPRDFMVHTVPEEEFYYAPVLVAVFAWVSCPFYSLLARGTLAGALFAVVVPAGLWLVGETGLGLIWSAKNPAASIPSPVPGLLLYCMVMGPLYSLATAVGGWRLFRKLQVAGDGTGGQLLHSVGRPLDQFLRLFSRGVTGGASALIRKELRLQILPWIMAGCYLVLAVTAKVAKACLPANEIPFDEIQIALAAGAPYFCLMVGACTIAEERRLGTLDWQLTSPTSVHKQWMIKIGVAACLVVVLGALLPIGVLSGTLSESMLHDLAGTWDELPLEAPAIFVAFTAAVLLLGAYASSFSRTAAGATFAAMGMGMGLMVAVILFPTLVVRGMEQRMQAMEVWGNPAQLSTQLFGVSRETVEWLRTGGLLLAPLALSIVWWKLAALNFREGIPGRRRLVGQLGVMGGMGVVIGIFVSAWMIAYLNVRLRHDFMRPVPTDARPAQLKVKAVPAAPKLEDSEPIPAPPAEPK